MSMINQKEYLKKYLSLGDEKEKSKKRKKRARIMQNRLKIIDDDIDVPHNVNEDEMKEFLTAEDAPQVVGIIDDRPMSMRIDDYRKSDKWKLVGSDDELKEKENDSKITFKTSRQSDSDASPPRKSKKYSDDDLSPPRIKVKHEKSPPRKTKKYDSDTSPPRKSRRDSDASPPRKSKKYDSDTSPVRKSNKKSESPPRRSRKHSNSDKNSPRQSRRDSDVSPARKYRQNSDVSPPRKSRRGSDISPPRKSKRDYDVSPPRKSRRDNDMSPPRKSRKQSDVSPPRTSRRDVDISPPRKSRKESDISPPRTSRRDVDISPPRKSRKESDISPPRTFRRDVDMSPPRKYRKESDISPPRTTRRESNSDLSPPRQYSPPRKNIKNSNSEQKPIKKSRWDASSPIRKVEKYSSPPRKNKTDDRYENKKETHPSSGSKQDKISSSPERSKPQKKMTKTLDGKKAGIQNAEDLKSEITALKKREEDLFKNMSAEVSGKDAAPIMRDRKTGKKRDLEKELLDEYEKQKIENVKKEKYDKWGKGLKQVEDHKEKIEQDLHEMSKPLARYADDEDLEKHLKEQEREGDPMLQYIRKKRRQEAVASGNPLDLKPQYDGEFMPNRYGIPPGHRWDGVDRSNGYEKEWFKVQNSKKAVEEEIYKWSTEDM